MSKLLRFSETIGCGATIQLDSGEVVIVSVARAGVLVALTDENKGFVKRISGLFSIGTKLYNETNVHKAAALAETLYGLFSNKPPILNFKNPVLTAFSSAVWHCSSAAEVCVMLNQSADVQDTSKAAKMWPPRRSPEMTTATYFLFYSDRTKAEIRFVPTEIDSWVSRWNADFPHRLITRVVAAQGRVVWQLERVPLEITLQHPKPGQPGETGTRSERSEPGVPSSRGPFRLTEEEHRAAIRKINVDKFGNIEIARAHDQMIKAIHRLDFAKAPPRPPYVFSREQLAKLSSEDFRAAALIVKSYDQENTALSTVYDNMAEKMEEEEMESLHRDAINGDAWAQFNLGEAYNEGWGVSKDLEEALRWWHAAGEQGSTAAQYQLGCAYADGEGVVRSYITAHMWFSLAIEALGHVGPVIFYNPSADQQREQLEGVMTVEQIEDAKRRAAVWIEEHAVDMVCA